MFKSGKYLIPAIVVAVAPAPASALNPHMQIEQVIGGVNGNASAQAIQLRMRKSGQFEASFRICVEDAAGANPIEIIDILTNVPAGEAGRRVLIASQAFVNTFSPAVVPDFTMTRLIPPSYLAAGSLTYRRNGCGGEILWRLSWGGASYTGPGSVERTPGGNDQDGNANPPFDGALPSTSSQALLFTGAAIDLSTTNAAQYEVTAGAAVFTNNAGTSFPIPPSGACCFVGSGGCMNNVQQRYCAPNNRYGGDDSTCATINPPCVVPTGACCDDSTGVCTEAVTPNTCWGSARRYGGDDSTCAMINPPCVVSTGACCDDSTGACTEAVTQSTCEGSGRRHGGNDSTCATINPPCVVSTGACCDDSTGVCTEAVTQITCWASDRRYGGNNVLCKDIDPACVPPPLGTIVWNTDPLSPERATRSLRFRLTPPATAAASNGQSAIKVTMIDLQNPNPPNLPQYPPPDFSAYESATCTATGEMNGCARWVGKPGTFLETQDNPGLGSYRASRLQCTPFYHDWALETATSPITVVGAEIAPSSEYSVQSYAASCKGMETGCTNVSAPVTMLTRRSGDVEAPFNPPSTTTQPNAVDVTQLVNKYKSVNGALPKATVQLQPNLPELNADISALDIVAVVDAVKQFAYPFSGPCPCPSAVTCNTTPCATPGVCVTTYGAGSLCVKTCNGGTNLGDPCINNTHCPGGACSNGICRDRCGRCTP